MKNYLLLFLILSPLHGMQREFSESQQGIAFFSLPGDLRKHILLMVASAPNNGKFDHEKGLDFSENLTAAILNVKNVMISRKAYAYFDDVRLAGDLIQIVYKRFPHVKKALIAAKFNTTGAGKWIREYIETQYGFSDALNTFIHLAEFGAAPDLNFMIKYLPQLVNQISQTSFDSQTKNVTPLMAAARAANVPAMQQLLQVPHIDLHKKNTANRDALWFAQQSKGQHKDAAVKILQAYGQ